MNDNKVLSMEILRAKYYIIDTDDEEREIGETDMTHIENTFKISTLDET